MTCSIQMIKPSPVVQEWTKVFPDFTTVTGSCQFIKKLIAVSLSSVTYIRGIFPEKAYGERKLCGIKLKLLTEDSGVDSVDKFIDLVRSCYEAVDKKYLHQLNIGICLDAENNEEVIESYSLDFRYREDEFSIQTHMGSRKLMEDNPTIEATLQVLKSILDISDLLEPLPKKAYLTMKLLYNETAPSDYQPPGFQPCENEKFSYPPDPLKLEIGKVFTDLHGYKMYLKTTLHKESLSQIRRSQLQEANRRIQPTDDLNQGVPDLMTSNTKDNDIIEDTVQDVDDQDNLISYTKGKDIIEDTVQDVDDQMEEEAASEDEINCICDCKKDSETDILECLFCGKKQHSVCYGILKSDELSSDFYCIYCISEAPQKNSVDFIYSLHENDQKVLGAFRRALVLLTSLKFITPFQLEKTLECSKQSARDLLEKLEREGFVKKSGNKYIVDEKKISNGYLEYFPRSIRKEKVAESQNKTMSKEMKSLEEIKGIQRNSSFRTKEIPLPKDEMDYAVHKRVQKLSLQPTEKQRGRPKRRSLKEMTENDYFSQDLFQSQPSKKRRPLKSRKCINIRQ